MTFEQKLLIQIDFIDSRQTPAKKTRNHYIQKTQTATDFKRDDKRIGHPSSRFESSFPYFSLYSQFRQKAHDSLERER